VPMTPEDALRQTIEDRKARIEEGRRDRRIRAFTSLLSALVAIGAAYLAFLQALQQINATERFQIVDSETAAGGAVLRIDTRTGQSWVLREGAGGATWTSVATVTP
jgi:hypothetical protein